MYVVGVNPLNRLVGTCMFAHRYCVPSVVRTTTFVACVGSVVVVVTLVSVVDTDVSVDMESDAAVDVSIGITNGFSAVYEMVHAANGPHGVVTAVMVPDT